MRISAGIPEFAGLSIHPTAASMIIHTQACHSSESPATHSSVLSAYTVIAGKCSEYFVLNAFPDLPRPARLADIPPGCSLHALHDRRPGSCARHDTSVVFHVEKFAVSKATRAFQVDSQSMFHDFQIWDVIETVGHRSAIPVLLFDPGLRA